MQRFAILIVTVALAGCAGSSSTPAEMDSGEMDMSKPGMPAELSKLERWVGTWHGTAQIVSPIPDGQTVPTTFKGDSSFTWTFGGMFLKGEGWHESPDGSRSEFVQYMGWDPKEQKYFSWFMNDRGGRSESWMTFSEDGNTMETTGTGQDSHGNPSSFSSRSTFTDSNTMEWVYTEKSAKKEMTMKGTSHRQ